MNPLPNPRKIISMETANSLLDDPGFVRNSLGSTWYEHNGKTYCMIGTLYGVDYFVEDDSYHDDFKEGK